METTLDHFRDHGWMRIVKGASASSVAAMLDALWGALAQEGILRDRPGTWNVERPAHLQQLRRDAAFRWRPTAVLQQALEAIVGTGFEEPTDWGSAFIAFPSPSPWGIPFKGWHIDANYRSPLFPARGVKTLALLSKVEPRGGGTQVLAGSHRLVHGWFERNPPPASARSSELRSLLRAHPYMNGLFSSGSGEQRAARFMAEETHDGVPLRVVELTGEPGDVILMHPLLMHTAAPNNRAEPRLMISGGVTTDLWGWETR